VLTAGLLVDEVTGLVEPLASLLAMLVDEALHLVLDVVEHAHGRPPLHGRVGRPPPDSATVGT